MSGCSASSTYLDKPESESNFLSRLQTQYSTAINNMSTPMSTPLPVYGNGNGDSKHILGSFSNNHHRLNSSANVGMNSHGNFTTNSTSSMSVLEQQKKLKQEVRRERNRTAAAKCRQRKLDKIAYLQFSIANYQATNGHLEFLADQLRGEIQELRQCLSDHQRHGCVCDFGLAAQHN